MPSLDNDMFNGQFPVYEQPLEEACWSGYKQVGMKEVKGRMVPNCVPMEEAIDPKKALAKALQMLGKAAKQEPTPDFRSMSPEQRRNYMGDKAERRHPAVPLRMIAQHGNEPARSQARFALSEPMVEKYTLEELMDMLEEAGYSLEENKLTRALAGLGLAGAALAGSADDAEAQRNIELPRARTGTQIIKITPQNRPTTTPTTSRPTTTRVTNTEPEFTYHPEEPTRRTEFDTTFVTNTPERDIHAALDAGRQQMLKRGIGQGGSEADLQYDPTTKTATVKIVGGRRIDANPPKIKMTKTRDGYTIPEWIAMLEEAGYDIEESLYKNLRTAATIGLGALKLGSLETDPEKFDAGPTQGPNPTLQPKQTISLARKPVVTSKTADGRTRYDVKDPNDLKKTKFSYVAEENEINEYCSRCLMEVLMGKHPEQLGEAQYQGRSVPLGKPMRGDVKKFKVFVKDPSTGNVKKVNFGDPNMRIKKSNPARRRSFRARHNCANPGPRTKARYWSCRKW